MALFQKCVLPRFVSQELVGRIERDFIEPSGNTCLAAKRRGTLHDLDKYLLGNVVGGGTALHDSVSQVANPSQMALDQLFQVSSDPGSLKPGNQLFVGSGQSSLSPSL